MKRSIKIFSDGGARGNPGPAAYGVIIKDKEGNVIESFGKYLGEATNNQAEYEGLIAGLAAAKRIDAEEVAFYMDSELLVKQMKGEYKVKNAGLQPLFLRAYNNAAVLKSVTYHHVPRALNKEADAEVNKAIDTAIN